MRRRPARPLPPGKYSQANISAASAAREAARPANAKGPRSGRAGTFCSFRWRHGDSNPEPPACKAGALPIAPCPRKENLSSITYRFRFGYRPLELADLVGRVLPDSLLCGSFLPLFVGEDSCSRRCHNCQQLLHGISSCRCGPPFARCSVGVPGLEPGTSSLSAKRSNRLSYTPRTSSGRDKTLPHLFSGAKSGRFPSSGRAAAARPEPERISRPSG